MFALSLNEGGKRQQNCGLVYRFTPSPFCLSFFRSRSLAHAHSSSLTWKQSHSCLSSLSHSLYRCLVPLKAPTRSLRAISVLNSLYQFSAFQSICFPGFVVREMEDFEIKTWNNQSQVKVLLILKKKERKVLLLWRTKQKTFWTNSRVSCLVVFFTCGVSRWDEKATECVCVCIEMCVSRGVIRAVPCGTLLPRGDSYVL